MGGGGGGVSHDAPQEPFFTLALNAVRFCPSQPAMEIRRFHPGAVGFWLALRGR